MTPSAEPDWPYDADRDDPLTALRIPVTTLAPRWCYFASFDGDSAERPTEAETTMLRSYIDYRLSEYREFYQDKIRRKHPFDIDAGINTVTFHKYAADDWAYRQSTWQVGPLFWPGPQHWRGQYGKGPGTRAHSLLQLLDHMRCCGGDKPVRAWVEWKAAHRDVFGQPEEDNHG